MAMLYSSPLLRMTTILAMMFAMMKYSPKIIVEVDALVSPNALGSNAVIKKKIAAKGRDGFRMMMKYSRSAHNTCSWHYYSPLRTSSASPSSPLRSFKQIRMTQNENDVVNSETAPIDPEPFGVGEKTIALMQMVEAAAAEAETAAATASEKAKEKEEIEETQTFSTDKEEEDSEDKTTSVIITEKKEATLQPASALSFLSIIRFLTPTLALWIAPPIMSLIDTSVVGRYCGSVDLAALGPGCTLVDSTSYLFMFLATATTNLVATARAEGREDDADRAIGESLFLSLCSGLMLSTLILLFGQTLLRLIAGKESLNVVPSATKYALVRSLGQPATIFASVSRASFLADKDTAGPLVSVSLAFMGNAIGTYVLVKYAGMGIVGAAIGTLLADVSAALFLFRRMKKMRLEKFRNKQQGQVEEESIVNNVSTTTATDILDETKAKTSSQTEGSQSDTTTTINTTPPPLIVVPTSSNLKNFLQYAAPIFFTILGKSVVYNGVSLAVGRINSLALAAHQVLLRSFFFWTPVGDSVGMTSQVFLPSILAQEKKTGIPKHGAKRALFLSGVISGGIAATLAGWLPTGGVSLFTSDEKIIELLKITAPVLSYSVLMHAIALTCEGMLLAQKDLKFLSRSYVLTTIITAAVLMSPLRPTTLGASWWILALFQGGRALQFSLRTVWLSRRRHLGDGWKEREKELALS